MDVEGQKTRLVFYKKNGTLFGNAYQNNKLIYKEGFGSQFSWYNKALHRA